MATVRFYWIEIGDLIKVITERMDSWQRYREEQLQRTESEASELRRNLNELRTKFFQLERAFEINLQSQARLELQFNRTKLESEGRSQQRFVRCLRFKELFSKSENIFRVTLLTR